MKRIRAALVIGWIGLMMIVSLPLFLISFIIGKSDKIKEQWFAQHFIQFVFRGALKAASTNLTVKGFENIPRDTAVLYVSNHRSFFDIISIYSLVPGLTGIVAKESIKKVPILHAWMKILKCLFLNRADTREALKTILTGIDNIKSGVSMLIFPEGTRGPSNTEMLPFKEGSFKLATKPQVPIVPIALTNTGTIFEDNGGLRIQKCHAIIEFGKPIYTKDLDREAQKTLCADTQAIIQEMLLNNVNEI